MDIVSRLKKYIAYLEIQTTLFADNCKIPRPTLSQLLNGRNKKVSDELINKIHVAYPNLSMLWLMFGEGDMLINENNEISEAQNSGFKSLFDEEYPNNENTGTKIDFGKSLSNSSLKNNQDNENPDFEVTDVPNESNPTRKNENPASKANTISFSTASKKKIVNIIVYYNDNSFESFLPSYNQD
ncbi:MAG: hypothetical protein K2M94_00265 [Paramuribaculum sp.]|nr:hypothetical protein [Paramuribaculum sp.]